MNGNDAFVVFSYGIRKHFYLIEVDFVTFGCIASIRNNSVVGCEIHNSIFAINGNVVDFIFNNKVGTLKSIFTGYKNIDGDSVKLNSFQKILAAIGILAALAIVPYSINTQKIAAEAENTESAEQGNGEEEGEEEED